MKQVSLAALCILSINIQSMQHPAVGSDAEEGLRWLIKDAPYMAPEKAVQVTYGWQAGMSFLKRYMQRNFNLADIYEDVVYFNECEYSTAIYGMTYPQIRIFLTAVSELCVPSSYKTSDTLCQKYIQLIGRWKKFDAENPTYRQAWENGDWKEIRKAINAKQ